MQRFVLVIGAGQAGLAAGYHLARAGVPFLIVDGAKRVGDSWRTRYDSLTLFTPRQFSALPGLNLDGNRELYPDRDEFADYLERYASHFELPIRLNASVVRLYRENGIFKATFDDGTEIEASEVVVATGGFQHALLVAVAGQFGSEVLQLTTQTYRNPRQLPDGPVLVVGDGASGRDIVAEAVQTQPAILSTGKPRKLFPERVFGKSVWWWLNVSGVLRAPAESWIGRTLKQSDAFPDRDRSLGSLVGRGVRIAPRLAGASGNEARFADGTSAGIRTVIWAVGYRDDNRWMDVPGAIAADGSVLQRGGISPVAGLFFVGRPWQRNRASALIMGAGPDAGHVVTSLLHERERQGTLPTG
jgi:putative flavoprotein involved in K+ transport